MWPVFVSFGIALAGVAFQLVAYSRMPARIPVHTGMTGVPGKERMSRRYILIVPIVFGIVAIVLPMIFATVVPNQMRSALQQAAPGIVLAATTWFIGAVFWDIASVEAGRPTRMLWIVVFGGFIAANVMMYMINVSRSSYHA